MQSSMTPAHMPLYIHGILDAGPATSHRHHAGRCHITVCRIVGM